MTEENRKIYEDKERLIESELESTRDIMSKMLDKLPNEELPFMEPHLRSLYFETYFLLAEGFYNASLVLMGILLENVVKEKLFLEKVSDEKLENMNFGQALNEVKSFISEEEFKFLEDRKKRLRNPYAHYNKMKLSKGIYFPAWKIPSDQIIPKLLELDKKVKNKEITESQARKELIQGINPQPISSKELRPVSQVAKSKFDKEQSLDVFFEIDKFVRKFAEKYFKPENE